MQKKQVKENINFERPFYLKRILIAFIITCVIFLILFFISFSIDYSVFQKTNTRINDFEKNIEKLKNLSENFQCNPLLESEAKNILNDAIYKIGFLEEKFGKNDPRVIEQKKYYSKLQYEHYLLLKKINNQCRKNTIFLFFIYTNSDSEALKEMTDRLSFVLGNYYAQNKEHIMLYSIDYNLDLKFIKQMIKENNITHPPVVLNIETGKFIYADNIDDLTNFVKGIQNEMQIQ